MLQNPDCAVLGVGEIAARAGLTPTWFSSAFKSCFGESPREFRRRRFDEMAGGPDGPPGSP
ncbi:hypothetical protein [Actinoallomurus iriomotensis]|uniref:HTH araC/xylS-type domain-containing protein n=1 Tax=Actinoallomurus iriomotensis TaxID=478107 RepID=A0A9W6VXL6_9ACTN|nr:hypothetical protein [Actinoallomurus iriomotensis]GLY84005.1 hypothetical protein Airi02_019340 [Actinoallomurus iriomotensis]